MSSEKENYVFLVKPESQDNFENSLAFLTHKFNTWLKDDASDEEKKEVAKAFRAFTVCFDTPTTESTGYKSDAELKFTVERMIEKFTATRSIKYGFTSRKRVEDIPEKDGEPNWGWLFMTFEDFILEVLFSLNTFIKVGAVEFKVIEDGKDVSKRRFIETTYKHITRIVEEKLGGQAKKDMTFYKKSVLTSFIAHEFGFKMSRADSLLTASDFTCMELHGHVKYYLKDIRAKEIEEEKVKKRAKIKSKKIDKKE